MKVTYHPNSEHVLPLQFLLVSDTEMAALARRLGAVTFDEQVMLARHYQAQGLNQNGFSDREAELAGEVALRLEQMNLLLKNTLVHLVEYSKRMGGKRVQGDPRGQLWFTMFMNAESFYYFAHRLQDILEDERLPHISGFKRSRMITLIRNHLVEHPYGTYKDHGGSHGALSHRDGPIILVRGKGKPPAKLRPRQDPGLFPNARELGDSVRPILERAVAKLGGPVLDPRRSK